MSMHISPSLYIIYMSMHISPSLYIIYMSMHIPSSDCHPRAPRHTLIVILATTTTHDLVGRGCCCLATTVDFTASLSMFVLLRLTLDVTPRPNRPKNLHLKRNPTYTSPYISRNLFPIFTIFTITVIALDAPARMQADQRGGLGIQRNLFMQQFFHHGLAIPR